MASEPKSLTPISTKLTCNLAETSLDTRNKETRTKKDSDLGKISSTQLNVFSSKGVDLNDKKQSRFRKEDQNH